MHFVSGRLMQRGSNKEIGAKGLPDWQPTTGDDSMERQQQREKCRFGFYLAPDSGFCTKGKALRRLGFSTIQIYITFFPLYLFYYIIELG